MAKKKIPNPWRPPQGSLPPITSALRVRRLKLPTPEKWEQRLRHDNRLAVKTIDALVNERLPRPVLVRLLIQLEAAGRLFPVPRAKIDRIHLLGTKWLAALEYLAASDLAYKLRFEREQPDHSAAREELVWNTLALVWDVSQLSSQSSKRESYRRNELLRVLVRRVRWATGKFHDGKLDILVGAVVPDWSSMAIWRRDHKALWRGRSELELAWDRAARGEPVDDVTDWQLAPEDDE